MHPDRSDRRPERHLFLQRMAAVGAVSVLSAHFPFSTPSMATTVTGEDRAILRVAQIAEALAVTTYTQIVAHAPFFTRLFPQDQAYLQSARQQEMAHYLLVHRLVVAPLAYSQFFYPKEMFVSGKTTVTTLIALEEAFIAAYLVGVRHFSSDDLRVAAARIMGVESDHRTMTRVLAPGLDPTDGGPLRTVKGIQGIAERVDPASNNGYERTLGWTHIDQAMETLLPFVDRVAAAKAGFDTTKRYAFQPFTPTLTTPLGAF